jgi:hypothetical protein
VFISMNETAGLPLANKGIGSDCSGLLDTISSWILPHSMSQSSEIQGVEWLCEPDGKSLNEQLMNALAKMVDTSFVVSKERGHVIVFLHGSFIGVIGTNQGIIYADAIYAIKRLRHMVNRGKVRVIRWHLELWQPHAN